MKTHRKVSASLDDEAYEVGQFILVRARKK